VPIPMSSVISRKSTPMATGSRGGGAKAQERR
jgi:hypothetical protein